MHQWIDEFKALLIGQQGYSGNASELYSTLR